MYKHAVVALIAMLVSSASCTTEEASSPKLDEKYASHLADIIPVLDLMAESQDGRVVLDLRDSDYGYWIEQGTELGSVDLICPSGRLMNLESWMGELGVSLPEKEEGYVMFSSGRADAVSEKYIPVCDPPCYLHEESPREWVCLC